MKTVIGRSSVVLLVFCIVAAAHAAVGWETVGGIGLDAQTTPPPEPPGIYDWPYGIPYGIYTFPDDNGEKYARLVADNSLPEDSQYITQTMTGEIPAGWNAQQFLAYALPTNGATGIWVDLIYDGGVETYHGTAGASDSWGTTYWHVEPAANASLLTVRIGITKNPAYTTGYRSVLIDRALFWCWVNPPLQWENYDFEELQNRIYIEPSTLPSLKEENSTSTAYTIGLADLDSAYPLDANVVVTVDPDDQTRVNGQAASQAVQLTFTTSQPDQTHLVIVSAVDDMIMEGPHSSTITHTSSSADPDYDQLILPNLIVNIIDDDAPIGFFSVTLDGSTGIFETDRFQIHMLNGEITYFYNKITGTDYISGGPDTGSAVKTCTLYASHGGTNTVSGFGPKQDITYDVDNVYTYNTAYSVAKTDTHEITWCFNNSGVTSTIRAWLDPNNRDLCVQQQSSGPYTDIHRVRWAMTNIKPTLDVILPLSGGVRLRDSDTSVLRDYFMWPYYWNSQFVVLDGGSDGFYVYGADPDDWFKGLELDRRRTNNAFGFDTESNTPFTNTTTLYSVSWHINCYKGNWTLPVHQVREWMGQNYDIATRASWVDDVKLACFNVPTNSHADSYIAFDQLDDYIPAGNVLLGLTAWRYYIDYTGLHGAWLHRAPEYSTLATTWNTDHEHWRNAHGYKTMIWINAWQCRNDAGGYNVYSTFSPSDHIQNPMNTSEYWPYWYSGTADINPTSNAWRNEVINTQLNTGWSNMTIKPHGVMLDESFGVSQDGSGYTDGFTNTCDGVIQFHQDILSTLSQPLGLILAGEGLNDVTFRQEAFAHIHGYGATSDENGRWLVPTSVHHRLCPVFAVLYSPYTKLYGFWGLDGSGSSSDQCNEAYKILRFEPAIHPLPMYNGSYRILTENGGTEINPLAEEMINRANGSNRTPTLQSCSVTPADGTNVTGFDFQALYTDLDDEGPGAGSDAYVHVVIDGIVYDLDLVGDPTYTTGASFSLHLDDFSLGSHSVHFECWDTWHVVRYPADGELTFTVYRDSDVTDRGLTNLLDFAFFANQWMQPCSEPGWCGGTDFDHSQNVDFEDVLTFRSEYLK